MKVSLALFLGLTICRLAGANLCDIVMFPPGIDGSDWYGLRQSLELFKEIERNGTSPESRVYRAAKIDLKVRANEVLVDVDLKNGTLALRPLDPEGERLIAAGVSRKLYASIKYRLRLLLTEETPGTLQYKNIRLVLKVDAESEMLDIDFSTGSVTPRPLPFDNQAIGLPRRTFSWAKSVAQYEMSDADRQNWFRTLDRIEAQYPIRIDRGTGEIRLRESQS